MKFARQRLQTIFLVVPLLVPVMVFGQRMTFKFVKEISILNGKLPAKSQIRAISVNEQGEIYLVDVGLNRILHLDDQGKLLREVGGFGWSNEQFDRPLDIWAENSLDVFVADYNNNRIQRFDRNLNYVSSYSSDANLDDKLQFGFPVSVAFSRFGELFLAEAENHRVLRFSEAGQPAQSFGDYDWGAGTLEEPNSLCLSENDEVFVSDGMRQAIIRFDYYGNFLQEIRHEGMSQPGGLATDSGFLFVADDQAGRLFVFDTRGDFIVDFMPVMNPKGITSDTHLDVALLKNILYVLDSNARMIFCYQILLNHR